MRRLVKRLICLIRNHPAWHGEPNWDGCGWRFECVRCQTVEVLGPDC